MKKEETSIVTLQPSLLVWTRPVFALVITVASVLGAVPASEPAAERRSISPELIATAEKRFSEMGYWTGTVDDKIDKIDKIDKKTRYAVLAFQRVQGLKQTGELNQVAIEALKTASRPAARELGYPHIEVDLRRQVLFVVDASSTVSMVLPISSGNGKFFTVEGRTHRAVTPRGRFKVYRKIQGWRKSALGLLYYPNYLVEGVAIHGSPQIPNYPASHGCIRIPIPASKDLSDVTPVGTIVIVHDGDPVSLDRP